MTRPAEPVRPGRLAAVILQVYLVLSVVWAFELESRALLRILLLALVGFPIQHLLPARLRRGWFAALSLAGLALVLGPTLALWLVGLGLGLVLLAHLPVAFGVRLALLGAAGLVLVGQRAGWLAAPWPAALWPVLGSMFMFRLLIYLYDLRTGGAPFGPTRALAYFFMLPNVCFPLFPVVDYKTFCLTEYNDERFKIYQSGASWMVRGVIQLLLHRLLYQNFLGDPAAVFDLAGLAWYAASTYLLYLRISGSFHLIVGLLHLFGFNLSETHHRYLLSASFTDFWQRINIYWKDFMTKLFFYPAYFRLKDRLTPAGALVASTVFVFAVTWLLHSYQWFWLRGSFPLTWQDAVFWSTLALLVVGKMLHDQRRGRRRRLRPPRHTWRTAAGVAGRTAATFCAIVLLWSVWNAGSFGEWLALLGAARHTDAAGLGLVLAGLLLLGALGVAFGASSSARTEAGAAGDGRPVPFWRHALAGTLTAGALLALGLRPDLLAFEPHLVAGVDRLRRFELNAQDMRLLERGYYENLTDLTRVSPELWGLYQKRAWALIDELPEVRHIPDVLDIELPASTTLRFKGREMRVNRLGFRDREYDEHPAPGTYRFVLVGASMSLGGGVPGDLTFENRVEDRLNARGVAGPRYEILNLAVGGYGPLQKLRMLETKGFGLAPHAVLYDGHSEELGWVVGSLAAAIGRGHPIPWDFVRALLDEAGVDPAGGRTMAERRLAPHGERLLRWVYERIVAQCRERGIQPYYLHVPRVNEASDADRGAARRVMDLARDAGFTVLDMSAAYAGASRKDLVLAVWDWHPNQEGHRLLADALWTALGDAAFPGGPAAP